MIFNKFKEHSKKIMPYMSFIIPFIVGLAFSYFIFYIPLRIITSNNHQNYTYINIKEDNLINVTTKINFKPTKNIFAINLIKTKTFNTSNNKYQVELKIYYKDNKNTNITYSKIIENTNILDKVDSFNYITLKFLDDSNEILLTTSKDIQKNYTKEEILKSINDLEIEHIIHNITKNVNTIQKNNQSWE